jgi:hypothetical protein
MALDVPPVLYAPITKIDLEKQEVYGYASTPKRDQQGEIIKLEAVRDALPSYMEAPAVREMHLNSAVGTGIEGVVDTKGLWFGAKIVDPVAWAKVRTGVYRGFSIGGRVTSRDPDDRTVVTGIDLAEISLVDRPCNPEALFDIIKRSDENVLHKRAGHHLESGRFVTVAQSREDAVAQANAHEAAAVVADKKADKHRRRAAKARDDADPNGIMVHDALAETHASLADKHRGAASQYRNMADSMATKTDAPDNRGEIGVMTRKIDETLNEAQALIDGLAKAVNPEVMEGTHGSLVAAHEEAVQHDASAIESSEKAIAARSAANAKHADGKPDEAKHENEEAARHETAAREHHEMAHSLHTKVHEHFKTLKKGDTPNGGSNAASESERQEAGEVQKRRRNFMANVAAHHSAHAGKCTKCADNFDKCDGVEKGGKFSDHLRKVAGEREDMSKSIGVIESDLHDDAGDGGKTDNTTEKFIKFSKLLNFNGAYFSKAGHFVCKREFSDEKRKELAASGAAMSDGSFPIENKEDLHNAIQAHGRAKDPEKAKHHIISRAKALDATGDLPDGWHKVEKKEDPVVTKTEGGTADEPGDEETNKVFRLALSSHMLQNTEFFLSKFDTESTNALKKWAEQGLALLKKETEESCEDMDDEKDDEEKCDKLYAVADSMLAGARVPFVWLEKAADVADESLVKITKNDTLLKRAELSKQFRKGFRHLKKAHKRMMKAKKQQLMQKGADIFSKVTPTTAGPANTGEPGTSPVEVDESKRSTVQGGAADSGAGKNPDTAEKALQSIVKQLTPMLRLVQQNNEKTQKIEGENNALKARILALESTPIDTARKGGGGKLRIIGKADDAAGTTGAGSFEDLTPGKSNFVRKLEAIPPGSERAEALLKVSFVSNKA